ncbi:MAG: PD-(D/E)XK nuclease family protein, partial [Ruminiclostridium sp.]|nr:PD-(D/E)XK nuclease family protein [Ruminiclostridium sp.]
ASGDVSREFPVFFEYVPDSGEWSGISWENEEKPFIQGIADMFFIEDGEIVLVDYKTNTGVSPEELREEYRGQLEIYAAALSEALGMPVRQKLLYSFEHGEITVD